MGDMRIKEATCWNEFYSLLSMWSLFGLDPIEFKYVAMGLQRANFELSLMHHELAEHPLSRHLSTREPLYLFDASKPTVIEMLGWSDTLNTLVLIF